MSDRRSAFLEAYAWTRPLLAAPELAASWEDLSALAHFSVKGLAGHLVRAGGAVLAYLGTPVLHGKQPLDAAAYYASVLAGMDEAAHEQVRIRGEANAEGGPRRLLAKRDETEAKLRRALEEEQPDRLVRVFGDLVLRLEDYLVTRTVEILVHADDLAVSIGVEPPPMPTRAGDVAIKHLVDVARLRHGDRAVLVALSRRERDMPEALRVF